MKTLLLALIACGTASAQLSFRFPFDVELKANLGLSDEQVAKIRANNVELITRVAAREERLARLSSEVQRELLQAAPDPMAVGSRKAEIENACREEKRLAASTRELNLALLSETQKAKLKALSEAARMMTVVQEAGAANIYGVRPGGDFASFLLGGGIGVGFGPGVALAIPGLGLPACGTPVRRGNLGFPVLP